MPFQSVPDTAEAVVRYLRNGRVCTLTFYARALLGYDQELIDNLAAEMDSWATDNFKPLLTTQDLYQGVFVRGLQDIIDLASESTVGAGAGIRAVTPAPNSLALAVKRTTGFTGRSARGRVFVPLTLADFSTSEDFVTSTAANDWADALNLIRGALLPIGWAEVVVSRRSNGAVRPFGETLTVTGYGITDPRIDSMRRRMPTD
jgi:hypothetical protein